MPGAALTGDSVTWKAAAGQAQPSAVHAGWGPLLCCQSWFPGPGCPPLGLMQSLEGSPWYSLAGTWGRPDMATLTPGGAVFLPARW